MSDSSQGPGWWQASDGKWYPPEQHPNQQPAAAAPPPPGWSPPAEKKKGGALKWLLIIAGVFVLLIGGCIAIIGAAGNEVAKEIDRQIGTADEADYDVELSQCEHDPEFGTSTASGTITNSSSEPQGFEVEVRFETGDGQLIEISPTFIDRLEPGQSAPWETTTFGPRAGEDGNTCEIDEVSYSIFDE